MLFFSPGCGAHYGAFIDVVSPCFMCPSCFARLRAVVFSVNKLWLGLLIGSVLSAPDMIYEDIMIQENRKKYEWLASTLHEERFRKSCIWDRVAQ